MAPVAFQCHRERGGESPPFLFFFFDLLPGWEKGFPSGPWPPWWLRGESPPRRFDLSLSLSLFPYVSAFHRFLNSRRFVTLIGLNFGNDFYLDISFLAAKEGHQPPYGVATRAQGMPDPLGRAPCLVATSSTVSRGFFFQNFPNIPKISSVRFYPVWIPFDMDILRNIKHATDRNWHWALDQYVSPKII